MSMLDEAKRTVAALLLAGVPRKEIAERVGIHPTRVWQLQQEPEFATYLAEQDKLIREQVASIIGTRIAGEADASLSKIVHLRDKAQSEKVQLSASQDLLDRGGFKAVERVHEVHEHVLSPEFAQLLRDLRQEEDVVDGTVIEGVAELPERAG